MRILLSLLTVTLVGLAGCSGGGGGKEPSTAKPAAYNEVEASETTGSIVGVVVSESITPIEGVSVTILALTKTVATDAEGAFLFNGIPPGDYFLTAAKFGYQPVQQSATVVAGEQEPPLLRIQLLADASNLAFATTEVWEGFVTCAATAGASGGYAGGHICGEDTGSKYIAEFPFADGRFPDYVQDEMVWENTQPLGDSLSPGYYRAGLTDWKTVTGPSPLILSTTADEMHDEEATREANLTSLVIRVFPGHGDGVVATYNQKFVIYHTAFYGFTPREGWLFTIDGACEPAERCV